MTAAILSPGGDKSRPPASLLIFGAGGRLGATLVTAALRRGHQVRAVLRRTNPLPPHPHLEAVRGDI